MVKAIFIDYMGTTVDEHSPEMAEIVRRICKNSSLHDPRQVQRFILNTRRRYEADSYLDTYLTEDEIVTRLILDMEAQIGLRDDPAAALLLCLSLLPSQAIATFDSVDNDPPAILEQDELEASDDTPDDPEELVSLVPQSNASASKSRRLRSSPITL